MAKTGKLSKKIVFYDCDKRYADFRIQLQTDSLGQADFLRTIIHAYIRGDKDLMPFIDKMKKKEVHIPKKWVRESRRKRNLAQDKIQDLGLNEDEIQNIFDIIADE